MPPSAGGASGRWPAEAHAAIERFLSASRQPALLEPGEDHFPLAPGCFLVDWNGQRLTIQVWDRTRSLVRRVTGVKHENPGKLTLVIEKFPRREGQVLLLDLARPSLAGISLQEKRLSFREEFRRLLARNFPDWKIAELSTEQDLEHSLSRLYPRALLRKGRLGLAAMGAPPGGGDADGALSCGLIWLDYLRQREPKLTIEGLAVFLPQGWERATCLRLRFLDPAAARFQVYVYSPEGYADLVDLRDYGNVDTRLEPARDETAGLSGRVLSWTERLGRGPHVERISRGSGSLSLCVRGLEFARCAGDTLEFGLARKMAAAAQDLPEIEAIARELARLRSPQAPDRENPLYRLQPERWLESQIRSHLEEIDSSLLPAPV
ncbi:MAG: hypothetical protein EHM65_03015, partial [Acidobacteriales bacterium]